MNAPTKTALRLALALAITVALGGCDTLGVSDWFNTRKTVNIPGERIPVMPTDTQLTADPQLKDTPVILPDPTQNDSWPEAGYAPDNIAPNVTANDTLNRIWSVSAGEGDNDDAPLTTPPVVSGGRVYVIDADSVVSAFDANTGAKIWSAPLAPPDEDEPERGYGGGVAFADGKVYATSGFGFTVAIDAADGRIIWKTPADGPVHSVPVVDDGRVYVITRENQLVAMDAHDGHVLWDHQGSEETASMLAATSVAVSGETVIVPYTSGELFALRVETGRPSWNQALTRTGNVTALTDINDIAGRPVIDGDMVIAVNHSGSLVAVNLVSGEVVWSREMPSIQTPLVAGDFLYIVSTEGQVACLLRRDGRVKWTAQLPAYGDPDDKEDPIVWSGPVLMSNHLLLVSSTGKAVLLSPYTGEREREVDLPEGTRIAPVVANGTVYVLTDDADLVALR